jgi:hypothetical protein
MAEDTTRPKVWQSVLTVVISAGSFSALAVFLGRLWTSSYYAYFGLPTSDLTLDAGDYAFRTKEVLVMLLLAVAIAGIVVWKAQPFRAETATLTTPWWLVFGGAVLVAGLFWFAARRSSRIIESNWKSLAIVLGIVIGAGIGISIAIVRQRLLGDKQNLGTEAQPDPSQATNDTRSGAHAPPLPSPQLVGVAIVTILAAVWFVPESIVQLARASAADDVRNQNLAHVIVEFADKAPQSIRRADNDALSERAYLVLLTPERIAIAFTYPCRQIQTQATSSDADACDILTFKRDKVRSVRVFGKGGRPSNDTPERADSVTLDTIADDLTPRTILRQPFDFSETRTTTRDCRGAPIEGKHGVWFRLHPVQAGRIELINSDKHSEFYLATSDDPRACHRLDASNGIRVSTNQDVLLFVSRPISSELARGIIELRYAPLTLQADDCHIEADSSRPTQRTVDCADKHGLSFTFSTTTRSTITTTVDIADAQHPTCPSTNTDTPLVFLAGVELAPSECTPPASNSGGYSITYQGAQPLDAGSWSLAVCPTPRAGAKVTGATIRPTRAERPASEGVAPGAATTPVPTIGPTLTPTASQRLDCPS